MSLLIKTKLILENIFHKSGFSPFVYFNFNPKLQNLSKARKKDVDLVKKVKTRYQPIVFPEIIIPKNCSSQIIDSRKKIKKLNIPKSFKGKTVLDIGCAEGFFSIEAARRGAKEVLGIETSRIRLKIANTVKKAWNFENKVNFKNMSLQNLPSGQKFDIVFCLAVIHHYHGKLKNKKMLDTWAVLTNVKYLPFYKNMIKMVKKVALHTKKITYWEYPFTYFGYGSKPKNVDFNLLAKKWEKERIYKKVEFIGFSSRSHVKDRPLYRAYK